MHAIVSHTCMHNYAGDQHTENALYENVNRRVMAFQNALAFCGLKVHNVIRFKTPNLVNSTICRDLQVQLLLLVTHV